MTPAASSEALLGQREDVDETATVLHLCLRTGAASQASMYVRGTALRSRQQEWSGTPLHCIWRRSSKASSIRERMAPVQGLPLPDCRRALLQQEQQQPKLRTQKDVIPKPSFSYLSNTQKAECGSLTLISLPPTGTRYTSPSSECPSAGVSQPGAICAESKALGPEAGLRGCMKCHPTAALQWRNPKPKSPNQRLRSSCV